MFDSVDEALGLKIGHYLSSALIPLARGSFLGLEVVIVGLHEGLNVLRVTGNRPIP
jgi:hypothetical protein